MTDCVISTSQDYILIDLCLCSEPYCGREVKPQTGFGLLVSHCSGLSDWSHKRGPELKINKQLQSSQTIINQSLNTVTTLPFQWKRKGPDKNNVHLNHRA